MNEKDLAEIFKECGDIHDLVVIRERSTRIHRGCAFVTYCKRSSALEAVEKFHGKMALPPVSPAASSGRVKQMSG